LVLFIAIGAIFIHSKEYSLYSKIIHIKVKNNRKMKVKFILGMLLGLGSITSLRAQSTTDLEAIKQLCGCFRVSFDYAETFTTDSINQYYAKAKTAKTVVEYAFPIVESDSRIVIQHLLVIPDGRGTVIKHWREEWEYEQNQWWEYSGPQEWTKKTVPAEQVKGQWVQSVWEVEDAPRYAGSAAWIQANKEIFWLNTSDAPLPRREFTKRSDYNILNRTNRIVVSPHGYVHEQDNKKILRFADQNDQVIAEEKGYNTYRRIREEDCANARRFWTQEQAEYWAEIRKSWDLILRKHTKIQIKQKVNGQLLYEALDILYAKNLNSADRTAAITAILNQYVMILA